MTVSQKDVVTRKPHHCWGCTEEFPAGTKMGVVNDADMGTVKSCYWCCTCTDYITRYMHHDDVEDGFMYGELTRDESYYEFKEKKLNEKAKNISDNPIL
jgi:hypothetical protein